MILNLRLSLLVVAIALQLSGCVSCREASFYKYIANDENHSVKTDFGYPNSAYFDVGNKATFRVGVCGSPNYNSQPKIAEGVCASLLLVEEAVMQFQDTRLILRNSGGEQTVTSIKEINYEILCQRQPTGERTCTSSELSPVKGAPPTLTKANWASNNNFADIYHFAADLPFAGAVDTLEQGAWFGNQMSGRRRYRLYIEPFPLKGVHEFSVHLPNVSIDGQQYVLPVLTFRAVTEDICRIVPVN